MKITICHQYAIAPHQSGVTRHYLLARELIARGHDVTIIAAATSHKNPNACLLENAQSAKTVVHGTVPFLWLRAASASTGAAARLWNMTVFALRLAFGRDVRALGAPDIVIGNTPDPFTALAAAHLAHRTGAKFVLHIGDIWPQSLVDIGGISRLHPFIVFLGFIEKYLYRIADKIVTPLPSAKAHIVARGGDTARIYNLPMLVDLAAVKKRPLPENKVFTFMFAGSHGPGNGVDGIVAAVAAFEKRYPGIDFSVRLVGEGAEKKNLQKQAQGLGLRRIRFEDAVRKDVIYDTLAQADAFVVSISDHKVFKDHGISPNKIFDFMAAARPVVVASSASNNPVAEAEAGIAVAAGDASALADAMKRLMDTPVVDRVRMANAGRDYVESHHDLKKITDILEDILGASPSVAHKEKYAA